ncbi:MAG: hypothetical protein M3Q13_09470 [Pseudomonadota bacterium]|nr:hypothetical protein [Pseudomonadota bacterium]
MRCLQHVLWRGAMALGLMVAGVAGGYGLQEEPLRSGQSVEVCPEQIADRTTGLQITCIERADGHTRIRVLRA